MIYFLDILGTVAFAVGGAYKAKSKRLNVFGVIFLGAITAVGGGTIRDLIIGRTPLFYLRDSNYLIACLAAGAFTYTLPDFFKKTYSIFRFTDSVGLATFTIIGVSASQSHLFSFASSPTIMSALASIFLGMITGFGGGILRDTIVGDTPYAIKSGSNYVKSAFFGSAIFYFLSFWNNYAAAIISVIVTLYLREIVSEFGLYKKYYRAQQVGANS